MSTTTIRLPEDLKTRLDSLAAADGKSTHAFMVDALARAAELRERQLSFDAEVQGRWEHLQRTGLHYTTEDLRTHAKALVRDPTASPPKPRKLATAVTGSPSRKRVARAA